MLNRFLVPIAVETASLAYQIAIAHGMNAIRPLMFNVPENAQSVYNADAGDDIDPSQVANFLLGNLVYDTVTFMGNNADGSLSYYDLTSQQVVTVAKMQIPIAMCNVTKNIKVVETDVAGRNGSIKQYINIGDYSVSIKGIFTTGTSDKYPIEAMKALQAITNATTEVKVVSNFLNIFGINYLVFKECNFEQMDNTGRDEQRFSLTCVSEIPFTINVNQNGGTTSNYSTFNGTVSAAPAPTTI